MARAALYLSLMGLLMAGAAVAETVVLHGEVVGVHDGDTLTLLVEQEEIKIRLDGIDAPESGQAFGTQAKNALSETVFAKAVRVTVTDTDRYGRSIGVVEVADDRGRARNVNLAMVRAGFAWHYVEYSDDEDLAAAERQAREAERGLWVDPDPVAPWVWRKAQRKKK
jgi:endonuclease YncB( thermonuclease family)